jgi:hypothetical protein
LLEYDSRGRKESAEVYLALDYESSINGAKWYNRREN